MGARRDKILGAYIVLSPDLIQCIFQYNPNPCAILKVICTGVGFGSGTDTGSVLAYNEVGLIQGGGLVVEPYS